MSLAGAHAARLRLAVAIAAVPLLAYPLVTLADGALRFPSRADCARSPVEGEPVDLVYGRFDSPREANAFLKRVLEVGFAGTRMLADDCGRWRVVYVGIPSIDVAEEVQVEARTVGLDPQLERGTE